MNNVIPNDLVSQEFSTTLVIADTEIRRDKDGRYCLNDLHKAAGDNPSHAPSQWLRLQSTTSLIDEITSAIPIYDMHFSTSTDFKGLEPVKTIRGKGKNQGTYVIKELVYAYAMWISPIFTLKVIRVFDSVSSRIFTPSWSEVREAGVLTRHEATDKIKEFVNYAQSQGSMHADRYYIHFTELAYRSLFNLPTGFEVRNIRNRLDTRQLTSVAAVENLIGKTIDEGIAKSVPYHDVYNMAKAKCQAYGEIVGKTNVGSGYIRRQEAKQLDQISLKEPSAVYA